MGAKRWGQPEDGNSRNKSFFEKKKINKKVLTFADNTTYDSLACIADRKALFLLQYL